MIRPAVYGVFNGPAFSCVIAAALARWTATPRASRCGRYIARGSGSGPQVQPLLGCLTAGRSHREQGHA